MPGKVRREGIERNQDPLVGQRLYIIGSSINGTQDALRNQPGFGDAVRGDVAPTQSDYAPVDNLLHFPGAQPALGEVATHAYPDTPAAPNDVIPFSHLQPTEDFPAIVERPAA
ncbi:MAG TPA: hypothetical protein VFT16_04710 [Candidatus Saccharimonadales bacterium]|nr:hypothetical protein [Candidatus Saccharimonadales bacterium]